MTDLAKVSFELNEEMLSLIKKDYGVEQIVGKVATVVAGKKPMEAEKAAEDIFTRYGVDWIRKSLQLGEEYTDRTLEMLKAAIDSTGGELWFPLIPQRTLEIAYLATQDIEFLPIIENNPERLVYRVDDCKVFQAMGKQCGKELTGKTVCKHGCLTAVRTLFKELDFPGVRIEMEAATGKDGYCQFIVTRT